MVAASALTLHLGGQVSHYYTDTYSMTWPDVSFGRKNL